MYLFQDPLLGIVPGIQDTQDRLLQWVDRFQFDAKKIDVFSRLLFPSAFALFNAVYWTYYLSIDKGGAEGIVNR